uniref:Locustakinin-1 n=1 Tax=Locusta migratoria TaxID=7004 RepID=LOK1_LOCMI|nr:RecName: Full=Locustakinin-1; AltName: Full=Locustakinin I [Locusta migratoria]
AFSSWG